MNRPNNKDHFKINRDDAASDWRVKFKKGEKNPNSGTFFFNKEDHTIGNMMKMSLLSDQRVIFAGYRKPHPLEHVVEVQLRVREDVNATPQQVAQLTFDNLQTELGSIRSQLETKVYQFLEHEHS